jgi:4-hydroxy-3-polyprenylbenzoate decarboxylase
LGHEPALLAAAMIGSPDSNTDFGFAGWLRGAPVEIIPSAHSGLPIPAAGEVVLEGEMHPFDGTGATVKVRHMYLRSDAILLGNAPFLDATYGVLVSGTATLWNELERRGIANIAALNRRPWGVIILAIKQSGAGDVQRVASALVESSAGRNLRYAVIVDDDIDPYNLEKVFWAIATRYEAQRAVQIVRCLGDTEEGALGESADNNGHSAAIIDACRPFAWIDQFPRTTDISEALMQETVQKWGKVLERRA